VSWIAIDESIYKHRKTRRLSKRLRVPVARLVGHLAAMWLWGLANADRTGDLGAAMAEDLAFAAMWPEAGAEAFTAALLEVELLHEVDGRYRFHDWEAYTARYYDGKENAAANAKAGGEYGNHKRWHLNRGIFDEGCAHCQAERDPAQKELKPQLPLGPTLVPDVAPNRGRIASDVGGESLSESLPTLPTSLDRSNQPISPQQGESKLAQIARLKRDLALMPADFQNLRTYFPNAETNSRWIEWVEWVAKKESERKPEVKDRVGAFYGWLKKNDGSDKFTARGGLR
jgi:hypothetical protein